ncbi:sigma-54-dependent transcriptional regulator [Clostridium sp. AM33-3]|uniref:sigma-54-dependent Fis family transcriptional regulator n=1 Tax=Clostridium sp. AM33-3 TaxID=2292304 RepID=UPI000E4F1FF7|nr:sigma-54-dependent transcriptional regulator [Clostridium sp. AM33-3]RHT22575.1 sigma-54-dependent transcriptional regulator [Clostridium sp. AM33-3]
MENIHFLVISPYRGMNELVHEVLLSENQVQADCYIANLTEVDHLLNKLNLLNYDAIISRGGTADYLKERTTLPVYDVGIWSLDALRTIRLAQNFNQSMAIVGYENITSHARILCELLGYDIPIYTIWSEEDAITNMKQLKEMGISVVVCDVISRNLALSMGITPVLVTNGYESIQNTFRQAIALTQSALQSRREFTQLTMAFQNSPLACTIFDRSGKSIVSSLSEYETKILLPFLQEHFEALWESKDSSLEYNLKGNILRLTLKKSTMRNTTYLYVYSDLKEKKEMRKIDAITEKTAGNNAILDFSYFNSTHSLSSTRDLIEKYSHVSTPVLISGEKGTGKDWAAYNIYCKSNYRNAIFYQIDCAYATERNWTYLLTHHDSPLAHNGHSIYFKQMETIPSHIFSQLLSYIADTRLASRNRLYFSFATNNENHDSKPIITGITKLFSCLSLHLPPLRERPDDIPYLTTLYINRMNVELGKQIIGFDSKASLALKQFPWEGNLHQLQRIIYELMLITTAPYISYENTMRLLHKETALWISSEQAGYQFDLNQTLDHITYDVVRMILKEENNNQSKTAQRLGIGRSTLWRILKSHSDPAEPV